MSAPLDYFGHPIKIGDTVVYVGAGYTSFEREVVTKINPKTVTLGDQTQWGSFTRREFNKVIVVGDKEATSE